MAWHQKALSFPMANVSRVLTKYRVRGPAVYDFTVKTIRLGPVLES